MTLKDKVAEINPERIDNMVHGQVLGCPRDYKYLNCDCGSRKYSCAKKGCAYGKDFTCEECWNREFKEEGDKM